MTLLVQGGQPYIRAGEGAYIIADTDIQLTPEQGITWKVNNENTVKINIIQEDEDLPDNMIKIEADPDTDDFKNRGIVNIEASINGLSSSLNILIIGPDTEVVKFTEDENNIYKQVNNSSSDIFAYIEKNNNTRALNNLNITYEYMNYNLMNIIKEQYKPKQYLEFNGFIIPNPEKNELIHNKINITFNNKVYSLGFIEEEQLFKNIEALPQVPETCYLNEVTDIIIDVVPEDSYNYLNCIPYKSEDITDIEKLTSSIKGVFLQDTAKVTSLEITAYEQGSVDIAILPKWIKDIDYIREEYFNSSVDEEIKEALQRYIDYLNTLDLSSVTIKLNLE